VDLYVLFKLAFFLLLEIAPKFQYLCEPSLSSFFYLQNFCLIFYCHYK
jgi:hypothetical protein